jgi:hypothetical protein
MQQDPVSKFVLMQRHYLIHMHLNLRFHLLNRLVLCEQNVHDNVFNYETLCGWGKLFNSLCPSAGSLVIRGFKLRGVRWAEGRNYINNVRNFSQKN